MSTFDQPDRGPEGVESTGHGPVTPFGATATTDVLAAYDGGEPQARRASWFAVGALGLLVLALVAGVTYGVQSLSGGGTQPEEALPAGAVAFAEIDLDPPAGQKVNAFRFLRQFPALRGKLTGDDMRQVVFESVADDAGWADVDFSREVAPWLGQRIAVAAYPADRFGPANGQGDAPGASRDAFAIPKVVVALQVTDEGAARDGIAALISAAARPGLASGATAGSTPGFVVKDGYALLAESRALAERAAEATAEGALAESGDYASDMSGLGDGFASAWVDMTNGGPMAALANPLALGAAGNLAGVAAMSGGTGRAAYVARFDGPDAFEVVGRTTAVDVLADVAPAKLTGFDQLPATSAVAFGFAGGDALVDSSWESLRTRLEGNGLSMDAFADEAERSLGIKLPADLRTVLGSNLLAVLDSSGFEERRLDIGVRTTTDPVAAQPVIRRLTRALQRSQPEIRSNITDDGYIVATNGATVRALAATTGNSLGQQAVFRRALPDVADSRMALWIDVRPLVSRFMGLSERGDAPEADLAPIAGFGMTASTDGAEGSFRMRLVTD